MLTKVIDGEVVVLSAEEEAAIRALWASYGSKTPDELVAYAKDVSWRKEVGGITFAGIMIATDDRSQLKILGSRVAADADPNWSTEWDAADNATHTIDAQTMIMISDAVAAHVSQCFSIRAAVKAAIAAGDITTTDEIDAAFA